MQQNFQNKSNLIRSTEIQIKKARYRLIGSAFLLLIAIIVLFYVTTHIRIIKVDPSVIEIKNTASGAVHEAVNIKNFASQPTVTSSSESSIVAHHVIASVPIISKVINKVNNSSVSVAHTNSSTITSPRFVIKPIIITETTVSKLTPADILNGIKKSTNITYYYIQLLSVENRKALLQFKTTLTNKGIPSSILVVNTPNKKFYRLRVGPFSSKSEANNKLNQIEHIIS